MAAGARTAPPSRCCASALLAPRLPRRGCQPGAPRPVPAPPARGAHGAKGPGCLRSPLLARARLLPCGPLPALPHMHLLCPSFLPAPLISILTVTVASRRRCGGRPGPAEAAGGSQASARGRSGGQSRATSLSGLRVFFLSFLFSLCLLQDLKGQPRPRRGARRPRFLRSPDALCGPASPARTPSHKLGTAGYF